MTGMCRRCDFHGDLIQHAIDTGHPQCIVCQRESLNVHQRQTCAHCIGRTRADLADIEKLHSRLPGVLVENRFPALAPNDRPHGDGEPAIPGGDPLVMLGGGGTGSPAGRHVTTNDKPKPAVEYPPFDEHPAYVRGATRIVQGREHIADELGTDPQSVEGILAVHEDDWRTLLKDPAAGPPDVAGSVDYLTHHLDRMAQAYSEFDTFAVDIHNLHQRLQLVVGMSEQPVRGAACFDCGRGLVRRYRYPGDSHKPPYNPNHGPGLEDEWSCLNCGRVYEQAEYWLAVRAALEQQRGAAS